MCGKCFERKPLLKSPRFLWVAGFVTVLATGVALALGGIAFRP